LGDVLRVHRRPEGQPLLPLSTIPVSAAPNLAQLPAALRTKVRFEVIELDAFSCGSWIVIGRSWKQLSMRFRHAE